MTKGLIVSALGMFVMACSGCGGGGGGSATTTSNAQKQPVTIAMYGDSTMAGYTYPNGPCGAAGTGACDPSTAVITPDNAPYNMAASLAAQLIPVTVSNQGVSGAELSDLIAGRHGYAQSWAQTLPSLNARIAVANYAINDLGRGDETPELYGQYLAAWVDSVRAAGMIPVLEEPNPVCRPGYENLPAYVGQMDSVAAQKNVPLIDQYSYLLSLPNWQGMLSDCMHPKPEMYEIKGKREAQIIGPIAASLGS